MAEFTPESSIEIIQVELDFMTKKDNRILVTEHCVVAQCGFQGDATTLLKNMKGKIRVYEHQHQEQPTAPAIAAMLSTMLYYRLTTFIIIPEI